MDNPEEVLQALDEFQRVRPSEIPKELEDYLCFVAKTGDPVYQWSLIKPLFREKLIRVMSDFYESCPTLDLAASPNLEHFNYDIMKCNLLELLESFANAPFTVQRICELLTAPRKEYNRVDKFMRAIEKNILVVSTKEPEPAARRSENGDSMVNGSIEDEESIPTSQPTHEVEMESWMKDCTAEPNVSTNPPAIPEHDVSLMITASAVVIPAKLASKDFPNDNISTTSVIHGRTQIRATVKSASLSVSSFIAAAHEMANASNITSNESSSNSSTSVPATNDSPLISSNNSQNLSENVGSNSDAPSAIGIVVSDVAEAIINEDTSSQPSLDSENDDNDMNLSTTTPTATTPHNKKLQTTFQPKDFVKIDIEDNLKLSRKKYHCDSSGSQTIECKLPSLSSPSSSVINNETGINVIGEERLSPVRQRDESGSNSDDESKSSCDSSSESLEKRPRIDCDNDTSSSSSTADKTDSSENNFTSVISAKIESNSSNGESDEDAIKLSINEQLNDDKTQRNIGELADKSSELNSNLISQSDSLSTPAQHNPDFSSDSSVDSENSKSNESVSEVSGDPSSSSSSSETLKPIVEEPLFDSTENAESSQKVSQKSEQNSTVTIEEAMDDDVKESEGHALIPDPIPIIEEPKDDEASTENKPTVISELPEGNSPDSQIEEREILQSQESTNETSNTVQTMNKSQVGTDASTPVVEDEVTPTPILTSNLEEKHEELATGIVEEMDIDNEESMGAFQRIDDDNDDGDEPMEQESGELTKS